MSSRCHCHRTVTTSASSSPHRHSIPSSPCSPLSPPRRVALSHAILSPCRLTASKSFTQHLCLTSVMTVAVAGYSLPKSPEQSDLPLLEAFLLVDLQTFNQTLALKMDCSSPKAPIFSLHPFSQVCSSCLTSALPMLECYRILLEWIALVLWNLGSDRFRSTLVPFDGIYNALVRPLTAVCRFCPVFTMTAIASLSLPMWQIGKKTFMNCISPVILVRLDCHSPFSSLMELILLPITSLVLSGIVIGSIMSKVVLFRTKVRMLIVFRLTIDVADGLTLTTLEAMIPPRGFNQDGKAKEVFFFGCLCMDAASVELVSSRLSLYLVLSFCCFSSFVCSINMLVVVFVYLAPYCLVYPLQAEVKLV